MAVAELHFFAPDDLNGATIYETSTDDPWLHQIEIEPSLDRLGFGKVTFGRRVGESMLASGIIGPGVFIRVLVPSVSAIRYVWGFFIHAREQVLVSRDEKGGEGFEFGGPGPKHYLSNQILWEREYAGGAGTPDTDQGVWLWSGSGRPGAILNRLILESEAHVTDFLPDLTKSFSDTNDSDGVAWSTDVTVGDDFRMRMGDDYLKLLWQLENIGGLETRINLGEVGTPLMQLDAYQTFGRDLTGAMAADTVHFTEGVNILSEMTVGGDTLLRASHALVRGAEGTWKHAIRTSWSPGDPVRAIGYDFSVSSYEPTLEAAGKRFLRAHEEPGAFKLNVQPGWDPANGLYMPGWADTSGHYWYGDYVSITTGGGSPSILDYTADTHRITSINMKLAEAVDDTDADTRAVSWLIRLGLDEERTSDATSPPAAAGGGESGTNVHHHPANPRLCVPGVVGTLPVVTGIGFLGDGPGDGVLAFNIPSADDFTALYVWTRNTSAGTLAVQWQPHETDSGSRESLTKIASQAIGSDEIALWRLLSPTPTISGVSFVRVTDTANQEKMVAVHYATGVDQSSPNGTVAFATGSGTTSSVTPSGSGTLINAACWFANDQAGMGDPTPGGGQTQTWADSDNRPAGQPDSEAGAGYGGSTPTWTFSSSQSWAAGGVYLNGVSSGGGVNDGHPDLIGADDAAARCDHRHDVHRASAPTVNDDWATQGYKLGTIWAQLDDLDTPTEIVGVWMLVDDTEGAAVWLPWPGGSDTSTGSLPHELHGRFLATFHRDSDRDAYLLVSDDGITWTDAKGEALFTPVATSGDARDPSITHFDGRWWLVQTGSEDATADGFDLWVSDDLLEWTHVDAINIEGTFPSATAVWAPEWIRHSDGSPYLNPSTGFPGVVVSIASGGTTSAPTDFELYEMHATNRGMTAWSAPTEMTGTGLPAEMIDGQLLYVPEFDDGTPYKLWYKDEVTKHIEYAQSASLTTGYTVVEDGNWAGWKGANSIEGPNVVKLDDGRWRIYFNENDGFDSVAVYYSDSTDDWGTWTTKAAITAPYLMSHGTVLRIPSTFDHARDPDAHPQLAQAEHDHDADYAPIVHVHDIRWEPVVTDTGGGPELVFHDGDIVMTWADYS